MNRWIDRFASSPAAQRLDALPGPVWALGAYGFDRAVRIAGPLFSGLSGRGGFLDSLIGGGGFLATCLAGLLPLGLFVALAQRRAWALPLASAYAGLKALASLMACGGQLFHSASWRLGIGWLGSAVVGHLLWAAASLALLLYFERSERIARLFPREGRRMVPWAVVAMAIVFLATGG